MHMDPNVPWAICTPEIAKFIRSVTVELVEVCAEDGKWGAILREHGIKVTCFGKKPIKGLVLKGSYATAAKIPGSLLIVWPPDGTKISNCLAGVKRNIVILCGSETRFENDLNDCGYRIIAYMAANGRHITSNVYIYYHESFEQPFALN